MQRYFDITVQTVVLDGTKMEVISRFWHPSPEAAIKAHADAASHLRPHETLSAIQSPHNVVGSISPPAVAATVALPANEDRVLEPHEAPGAEQPIETAVKAFVAHVQDMVVKHYAKHFPQLEAPTIYSDAPGQKMIRIVSMSGGVKSAFCFVEIVTGNILKAARWGMAAKGARGTVFSPDHGISAVTVYGAKHLRQNRRAARRTPRPLLRKPQYVASGASVKQGERA